MDALEGAGEKKVMRKSVKSKRSAEESDIEQSATFASGEPAFVMSQEMWDELVMNYRETLVTAYNMCRGVQSVVNRVALGRMDIEYALERLQALCAVTHYCDFLGDDNFLADLYGRRPFPTPLGYDGLSRHPHNSGTCPYAPQSSEARRAR